MSTKADLPDLNVWLALTCVDHSHHKQALQYWVPGSPGAADASELLEALCRQPGVSLAAPEHDGFDVFHQLLRNEALPARLCTDAYLAALAIANGWRLVSFD